jgi:dipeptidyl aminopeptidase/acylaminoacyl peptidase
MKRFSSIGLLFLLITNFAVAQAPLTPEQLLSIGRVGAVGITKDGKSVVYRVSVPDIEANKNSSKLYSISLSGGEASLLDSVGNLVKDESLSPDGMYKITDQNVKLKDVAGSEVYKDMAKSDVKIYESLDYRHWDTWRDGSYRHVFLHKMVNGKPDAGIDLLKNEPYDSPQMPFGDEGDYVWNHDGSKVVYVCKKKAGTAYAISTNTDLYAYDIATGSTTNLTEGRMGYDMAPAFNSRGDMAWLSMARDGYEADKNDIIVRGKNGDMNLTKDWDGTVSDFKWSTDGKVIYFIAPIDGTKQLFVVDYPGMTKKLPVVKQLTNGDFDVSGIVGQSGNTLVVSRMDMNHAAELYTYDIAKNDLKQLTHVNDAIYAKVKMGKIERRYVTTTDNKQMLVWVVYPPDFDASKKYPTLLYCQGGPQSPVSQFYSFRWNFQLMAAQGYIVVAPNRRGLPGFGVKWNEAISKDWGGQSMRDYLSAIDDVSKESYVDKSRRGCIGASYGGYSVFNLAGMHEKRFKTFIAHAGVFNLKSMYGTTEEVFFTNFDAGGAYWEKDNAAAQKTYAEFDPSNNVGKWDTPMLVIHGGKDFRVPEGQGFEAFSALQLRGIKSKLVYFPEENHWILKPQNGIVWQREFFKWLKETL